jgi:hypothetical protein
MPGRGSYHQAPKSVWGRRDFVRIGSAGLLGLNAWDWFRMPSARAAAKDRSCILIWLMGGPPQQDMWDMKPDAPSEYRGIFKPIPTNVSGIQLSEHLPKTAKVMDKFAIIRSMTGKTAQHEPAQDYVLSGYPPLASLAYPSMGSVVAKQAGSRNGLPPYVAVAKPGYAYGPGFLGASYSPFAAGDPNQADYQVRDIRLPTDVDWDESSDRRLLLKQMDAQFLKNAAIRKADTRGEFAAVDDAYAKAVDLVSSAKAQKAFQIFEEPDAIREKYGRTPMGQGCLLARRLVEAGTRFVTVTTGMNVWDTHVRNFDMLQNDLLPSFDMAFSALVSDLHDRGMLDSTLVIANGEFGRTPKVNAAGGRDHWPKVWSCAMAGAGIRGGQIYGASDANAAEVKDKPVTVEDYTATVYELLGIDYSIEYQTPIGRPVRISNGKHIILT